MSTGQILRWPELIVTSYENAMGEPLCAAEELYGHEAVVLCHDRSADPRLVYVNLSAQRLWERPWEEFVGLPSRITAPVQARAERASALASEGVVRGYSGVRVTASGRLFRIVDATVWPVCDDGRRVGQAAMFTRVLEA